MHKGGTGDVLAGVIAALYSRINDPLLAAAAGSFLVKRAGEELWKNNLNWTKENSAKLSKLFLARHKIARQGLAKKYSLIYYNLSTKKIKTVLLNWKKENKMNEEDKKEEEIIKNWYLRKLANFITYIGLICTIGVPVLAFTVPERLWLMTLFAFLAGLTQFLQMSLSFPPVPLQKRGPV